jgi:hypothetical protein
LPFTKTNLSQDPKSCSAGLVGCHFTEKGGGRCPIVCKSCQDENGKKRSSGDAWRKNGDDTCSVSTCFSGVVTSGAIECPAPTCANPVTLPGKCCPSCPGGCRRGPGLQDFAEGETKPDMTDPCNECSCKDGDLNCVRMVCPVLPCEARLQRTPKGKCCPECTRRHGAVHSKLGRNMCLFQSRVFRRGRKGWPADECTTCTCDWSLQVRCQRTNCPAMLKCPKEKQVKRAGQCCPVCDGNGEEKALAAVRPTYCVNRGRKHADGSVWEGERCTSCSCEKGETRCRVAECPVLNCPIGSRPDRKNGDCCPKCEHEDGVCTVFGDPHYKTFDGRIFNFQVE